MSKPPGRLKGECRVKKSVQNLSIPAPGSPQEESSEFKVFQNQRVLKRILGALPYEDLLNCALVQKSWNSLVTQQKQAWKIFKLSLQSFLKRPAVNDDDFLKLKIGDWESSDLPSTFYSPITISSLSHLLESQSETQKVVWLILDLKLDKFVSPAVFIELKKCFNLIRPHLTRLIIDSATLPQQEDREDTTNFLLLDAPHLTKIYFRSHESPSILLPPQPLREVKVLKFPLHPAPRAANASIHLNEPSFLLEILEGTPNVQRIYNFPLNSFFLLKSGVNVDLQALTKVKSIGYQLRLSTASKNDELAILSLLAGQLCLDSLVITWSQANTIVWTYDWKKCFQNFSKILLSSKNDLKRLEIHNTSFVPFLNIPVLPSLTTLVLQGRCIDQVRFFSHFPDEPEGPKFCKRFPNLWSVELVKVTGNLSHLDLLLPPHLFQKNSSGTENGNIDVGSGCGNFEPCATVKYLRLRDRIVNGETVSSDILKKLAQYFPKLQILNVGEDWSWLEILLPTIWTSWPDLKEFIVEVLNSHNRQRTKCVDENIAGIPEEKCRELRKWQDKIEIDLDEYRSLPAISNMKYLKIFSIFCTDVSGDGKMANPPMLTHVSTFYGFQLVPELNFNLRFCNVDPNECFECN